MTNFRDETESQTPGLSIVVSMDNSPLPHIESFAYLAPSGLLRYSEAVPRGLGDRYDLTGIEDRACSKLTQFLADRGEADRAFRVRLRRAFMVTGDSGDEYLVTMMEEC